MRVTKLFAASLMVFGLTAGLALAQEGHPLKGSWLGDWGPNKTTRNQAFLVVDWDGKALSGMLNPGTDNLPLKNFTLTPPPPPPPAPARGQGGGGQGGGQGAGQGGGNRGQGGGQGGGAAAPAGGGQRGAAVPPAPAPPQEWLVHFEVDAKDRSGNAVKYVVDGKIENIGLPNRAVVGSWTVGTTKNDFRVVRQ